MRNLTLLPKAHLHLHFTGSMRPDTLAELALAQGVRLPGALLAGNAIDFGRGERGWFRFQRLYDAARACVRSEAAMRRVVDEAVADDAAEGSVRLEMQVDPTSYAPHVGGITPALEIVLDEAARAAARHGVSVGIIVAASRVRHPLEARTLARLAARYAISSNDDDAAASIGVVGFGLSNDERAGDTAAFAPAFRIARDAGLAAVPHAGELLGPPHIAQVFTDLAPRRLGHGVRAAADAALLDRLVAAGVAFEVCPASNVALGLFHEHSSLPLRTLVAAGADVALGADDPLLFGSRLNAQYDIARTVHGFDDAAIAELARGSIRASLAPAAQKATWLHQIDAWLQTS